MSRRGTSVVAGRFLVPGPLPEWMLFAELLRRRMSMRLGGALAADSEDIMLLHEPGQHPMAYPLADVTSRVLEPGEHATRHRDHGPGRFLTTHEVAAGRQP